MNTIRKIINIICCVLCAYFVLFLVAGDHEWMNPDYAVIFGTLTFLGYLITRKANNNQ